MSDSVFPIDGEHNPAKGLTKRELFAAMAMQGMLSNMKSSEEVERLMDLIPSASVQLADDLIRALGV